MRLLLGKRMMNLPQICSVIVIFSLVILLGFGSVGIAEAAKAPGVYATETNSKAVCGDRLCDTPMSVEEKIAEFRGESEELVMRGGTLTTGLSLMADFVGGLTGDAFVGAIGGAIFASVFPGSSDDGYTDALADMEASLTQHIDAQFEAQTSVLLSAMLDMQFTLVESMYEVQTEGYLHDARSAINTWHGSHDNYMLYLTQESITPHTNEQLYDFMQVEWNRDAIVNEVISSLADVGYLSQDLRVQGFPLYWMGQLVYIAYNQESALYHTEVADPNLSWHALKIPGIVANMERHLDNTVVDAKEIRALDITIECTPIETKDSQKLKNIPLVKESDHEKSFEGKNITIGSFTVEDRSAIECFVKDNQTGIESEPYAMTYTDWGLEAKCLNDSSYRDGDDLHGWTLLIKDDLCDYDLALYQTFEKTGTYSPTLQETKDAVEPYKLFSIALTVYPEVDEKFEPYYDALDDLCKLKDIPVPVSSESGICPEN